MTMMMMMNIRIATKI